MRTLIAQYNDKAQRLFVVDLESGRLTEADRSERNDITDLAWAPDSRWLAYRKTAGTRLAQIWVWSLESEKANPLTDPMVASFSPAFDPEGRYLYFLSNRDMNLTFSGWDETFVYTGPTRLYAGTLSADQLRPFQPRTDEEAAEDAGEGNREEEEKADSSVPDVEIDFDDFETRVVAIPGTSGR
ncbi:MAG: hypothetical protein P8049_12590 [Gemmatimonadota bacterium]